FKIHQYWKTKGKSVHVHPKYVSVPYTYCGQDYVINIPFSRALRRKTTSTQMFLLKETSEGIEEIELPHQHGLCYLVSASVLGGKSIIIVDYDQDKTWRFEGDEIPRIPH
ncbi:unnamed protein product, partial [marine sediment metagenome]